jgi:release factor glutamine methyltransferase
MIDLYKQLPLGNNPVIADIGTGSGCIGLTVLLENPAAKVDLYDIDPKALEIARLNAKRFKLSVKCYRANLLMPNYGPYQILLANLPYVPDNYQINLSALNEPRQAILGGSDGLDIYRQLFQQINNLDWQPNYILTESLPFQHKDLSQTARKYHFRLIKTDDFIQCYRNA